MKREYVKTIGMVALVVLLLAGLGLAQEPTGGKGYYRYPALHDTTIVFTAEGDLWQVGIGGGIARRLTTHHGEESRAAISPDGSMLAFSAQYEGPTEVYVMPLIGGVPRRMTYEGERSLVVGWTPDGDLLYSTSHFSTLPNRQLVRISVADDEQTRIPLWQANDGVYDPSGNSLYFTRLPFMGSNTKRYKGGAAKNIWKYTNGADEAIELTGDYPGMSMRPMWWQGRLYFASDRDGIMNIWSMDTTGGNLRQHTKHADYDIQSPSLSNGRIVYEQGADLWLYDIARDTDRKLDIRLSSDFDQLREQWVKNPMKYLTAANISPEGDKVALTARGQVFVAPVEKGRLVRATREDSVRYRQALFMPDGKTLLAMTDQTGELEFCTIAADGIGDIELLTGNGTVYRYEMTPSPDGRYIAYHDKDYKLWIYDTRDKKHTLVEESPVSNFADLRWSPDSRWLAYVAWAENFYSQIKVYSLDEKETATITSDRYDSYSPAWTPDGKWMYFLSDRTFSTVYGNVWGKREEEPYVDKTTKLYLVGLVKGLRSPFEPDNELTMAEDGKAKKDDKEDKKDEEKPATVTIDSEGIQDRAQLVPVEAGNYSNLTVNDKTVFWESRGPVGDRKRTLMAAGITNKDFEAKELADGLNWYELSSNGKKILLRKSDDLYVIDAGTNAPGNLSKNKVDLSAWEFPLNPREEFRQMFVEAWRLERDYFYDPNMHGVDWKAVLDKYMPLAKRVTDRLELSNVFGQMIGELSALHMYVFGGDIRSGEDTIEVAGLGARLVRDDKEEGFRIEHIYLNDPAYPDALSPLAKPSVNIQEGDIILAIDGVDALAETRPGVLLRNKVGKQVRLRIKEASSGKTRDVIVEPVSYRVASDLRYDEWEYRNRLTVERKGGGELGYVHLRATGTSDFSQWARDFYPVFNRKGLIIDMRHNNGGNIDSWIIGRLLRRAWAYWQGRKGIPEPNMQYAFTGHIAVLCDEWTVSDGELFTEGIKKLGLGKIIGTRTLGGEIWLSYSNVLVDKGIATAAESGVYGPEGEWLIEGHGVEPDIVVDNLPHETFTGKDAQLDTAIEYLKAQILSKPVETPQHPPYPNKSLQK